MRRGRAAAIFIAASIAVTGLAIRITPPTPPSTTAPATPADTGADVCAGGTHNGLLTTPTVQVPGGGTWTRSSAPTLTQAQALWPDAGITGVDTISATSNVTVFPTAHHVIYFTAGTHNMGDAINAQPGNVFVGAVGAIMDGGNSKPVAIIPAWFGEHGWDVVTHVHVEYMTIQHYKPALDGTGPNMLLANGADYWTFKYNDISHNDGGGGVSQNVGPAMAMASYETMQYNCLSFNGQYCINGFEYFGGGGSTPEWPGTQVNGPHHVVVDHNEFSHCNDVFYSQGSKVCSPPSDQGCSGDVKLWHTLDVAWTNNYEHDGGSFGFWPDTDNVKTTFTGNYIADTWAEAVFIEAGYNVTIQNNTFFHNAWGAGGCGAAAGNPCQVAGVELAAIYVSETGGETCVTGNCPLNGNGPAVVDISGNSMIDNWTGISEYENPDRFCGANFNGDCPISSQPEVTSGGCNVPALLTNTTLQRACRWHSQNVAIHDNYIQEIASNITAKPSTNVSYGLPACTTANLCAIPMAIYAQCGTMMTPNDPWAGTVIQNAIMYTQNNTFSNNTYIGSPIKFNAQENNHLVDWSSWHGPRGATNRAACNQPLPASFGFDTSGSVCFTNLARTTVCP